MAHSLPPSPLFVTDNMDIGDCDTKAEQQIKANNNIKDSSQEDRAPNGCLLRQVESSCDSMLGSETDEPQSEHSSTVLLLRDRTKPASASVQSASPHSKQHPLTI